MTVSPTAIGRGAVPAPVRRPRRRWQPGRSCRSCCQNLLAPSLQLIFGTKRRSKVCVCVCVQQIPTTAVARRLARVKASGNSEGLYMLVPPVIQQTRTMFTVAWSTAPPSASSPAVMEAAGRSVSERAGVGGICHRNGHRPSAARASRGKDEGSAAKLI